MALRMEATMKKLFFLLLVVILAGVNVVPAYADGPNPNVPIDVCLAYVTAPYRSGSNIKASGGVGCTEVVPWIKVVGQMIDDQGHTFWPTPLTKTCSGKNNCAWNVSTSYAGKSGRTWTSMTSGYWTTGNDYAQSSSVYIP